jgi:hypothetical protein
MARRIAAFAGLIGLTIAAPVAAQGVFDMGVLTNTLSQDAGAAPSPQAAPAPQPQTAPAGPAAFRFKPSPAVRKAMLAKFVDGVRQGDPNGATQIEAEFAKSDPIADIAKVLPRYGLRADDAADAFTVYWMNAWLASRGRIEESAPAQVAAVRAQAARAMGATAALKSATDADKQQFAEAMLLQGAMLESMLQQAKDDPAKLEQVKTAARQGAKGAGLDLDQVELTPTGFVKAAGAP